MQAAERARSGSGGPGGCLGVSPLEGGTPHQPPAPAAAGHENEQPDYVHKPEAPQRHKESQDGAQGAAAEVQGVGIMQGAIPQAQPGPQSLDSTLPMLPDGKSPVQL